MSYKDLSDDKLAGRHAVLKANVEKRQTNYNKLKDKHSKKLLAEDKKALDVCEKEVAKRKNAEQEKGER